MEIGDVILFIDPWIIVEVLEDGFRCISFDLSSSPTTMVKKLHIRERYLDRWEREDVDTRGAARRHEAIDSIFAADIVTTAW
jgi:hypothetical protein